MAEQSRAQPMLSALRLIQGPGKCGVHRGEGPLVKLVQVSSNKYLIDEHAALKLT